MSKESDCELSRFNQFIAEIITSGKADISPEQALANWRTFQATTSEYRATAEAIEQGLDELQNGDKGLTLEEFDRDFRTRHGLPKSLRQHGSQCQEFTEFDETVAAIQEALDDPSPDAPWEDFKK